MGDYYIKLNMQTRILKVKKKETDVNYTLTHTHTHKVGKRGGSAMKSLFS